MVAALASPWATVETVGSNAGIADPILEDVDGDGDLDVVTRHHNQRRMVWWTNAGAALSEGSVLSTQCKPIGLDLADFDGDGDLDLGTGGNSSNRFLVAENAGTAFGGQHILSSASTFRAVLAMPVDGDVLPDLVAFDSTNQQLVLRLNTSDPAGLDFAEAVSIGSVSSNAFGGPGLASIDIDADGDLDLIVAAGKLSLYKNQGGSFLAPVTIDTVDIGSTIYVADLDGDGDDDILGRFSGRAVWYENLGRAGFGAQRDVAGDIRANAFTVGDLDGDGDTDILLRDTDTGELIWVQNGDGGLVVRPSIGVAQGSFAVGDVDGDGDADVVAADPANNGLITFLNPLL